MNGIYFRSQLPVQVRKRAFHTQSLGLIVANTTMINGDNRNPATSRTGTSYLCYFSSHKGFFSTARPGRVVVNHSRSQKPLSKLLIRNSLLGFLSHGNRKMRIAKRERKLNFLPPERMVRQSNRKQLGYVALSTAQFIVQKQLQLVRASVEHRTSLSQTQAVASLGSAAPCAAYFSDTNLKLY